MSETNTPLAVSAPAQSKGTVEQAHHIIQTISMTLGIAGALGAAGVWLAANCFVGDVEIKLDKPVQSVSVKVYDKKGQESGYHMSHFQLMPGTYHLEVTPDGAKTRYADVCVKFACKNIVPVAVEPGQDEQPSSGGNHKEHWWQFRRK